jgi:putative hydrolase of the HAD superfamily
MAMFGRLRPKPDTRMLRALCARLRVHPSRCMLVEDTLRHQKAARSIGMRTAWLVRYQHGRRAVPSAGRPPYVDHRLHGLRALARAAARQSAKPARAHFQ